nr:MAG TPA: hypothetical protein [Caudoviricetes sp.]
MGQIVTLEICASKKRTYKKIKKILTFGTHKYIIELRNSKVRWKK